MKSVPRGLWIAVPLLLLVALFAVAQAAPAAEPVAAPVLAVPEPQAQTTPKPPAPVAVLEMVAVPGNPANANAITTTIKYITDTVVGQKTGTVALYTSGLTNSPLGVPVHLKASATDAKLKISKIAWTLTTPPGSKAAIKAADKAETEFTPDVVGIYKIDVVLTGDGGASPMASTKLHAGTYVGEGAGNCSQCHPNKAAEVVKTGHAKILADEIDNKRFPNVTTHYAETCIRCHTTGYYPGVANGGFADAQAQAKWTFPTFKQIDAAGKGGASNFAAMPAAVKNLANIQCESCHGPAKEHATTGANVMAVTMDDGVCDQCHNGGGHHPQGHRPHQRQTCRRSQRGVAGANRSEPAGLRPLSLRQGLCQLRRRSEEQGDLGQHTPGVGLFGLPRPAFRQERLPAAGRRRSAPRHPALRS